MLSKFKQVAAIALGVTFLDAAPAAGQEDAMSLLRQCRGKDSPAAMGLVSCASYLGGILDALAYWNGLAPGTSSVCPPGQGITNEQAMLIFIKWATDHPADLHLSKRGMAFEALANAFPCK